MGGRGRGRGGGGGRGGISWIKKEEPKFIRDFKERVAYKEQANLESKKKNPNDKDLNIEREEDLPQVVQLKAGDLDASEYVKMKDKEEVENAGSSFGKILFKRRKKEGEETAADIEEKKAKTAQLDAIFGLKDGVEKTEEEKEAERLELEAKKEAKEGEAKKVKMLDDDEDKDVKFGLQQPPVKKRFIDGPTSKVTSLSAAKVLEREKKAGNKKLLSFYDEEEEEEEEYRKEAFEEKMRKQAEKEAEDSD